MNPEFKMALILAGLGISNGFLYLNSEDSANLVAQIVCVSVAIYYFYLGLTSMFNSDNINKKDK